jgi:hypothetical protein
MRLLVPEVLEKVEKAATKEEKILILRQNFSPSILSILQIGFFKNVHMDLPEGRPPFKVDKDIPLGYSPTNIYAESRKFYIWTRPGVNIPRLKKESLFIGLLESVHWKEADVLIAMKDKKFTEMYPSLTFDLLHEAFGEKFPLREKPDSIKEEVEKAIKQIEAGNFVEVNLDTPPVKRRPGRPPGTGKKLKKQTEDLPKSQ